MKRGDLEKVVAGLDKDMETAFDRFAARHSRSYGQIAYEGYFESCGGRSLISGAPLPAWESQSPEIQKAWAQAAGDVIYAWEGVPE